MIIRIVQKRLSEAGGEGVAGVEGLGVCGLDWAKAELETWSDVESWTSVVSRRMSINEILGGFMGGPWVCL